MASQRPIWPDILDTSFRNVLNNRIRPYSTRDNKFIEGMPKPGLYDFLNYSLLLCILALPVILILYFIGIIK